MLKILLIIYIIGAFIWSGMFLWTVGKSVGWSLSKMFTKEYSINLGLVLILCVILWPAYTVLNLYVLLNKNAHDEAMTIMIYAMNKYE